MPESNFPSQSPLIVFGASARAAVHSARRSGIQAIGIDLFGDVDLDPSAPELTSQTNLDNVLDTTPLDLSEYPSGFESRLPGGRASQWMDVSGFENAPDLIDRMRARGTHLGNSGHVVNQVRDPRLLDELLVSNGLPSAWCFDASRLTRGKWLLKPKSSAGGLGLTRIDLDCDPARLHEYQRRMQTWLERGQQIQKFISGKTYGAVFLATPRQVECQGVTCLLNGRSELSAPGFAYCGSIGPFQLPESIRLQIESMGELIGNRFGLRGLFGIDVVVHDKGCWLIEVNPRYTASVEVLEIATNRPLLATHMHCFAAPADSVSTNATRPDPESGQTWVAKGIQYVPQGSRWTSTEAFVDDLLDQNRSHASPRFADIPQPGTVLLPGQPAFTVFASWRTPMEISIAIEALRGRAAEVSRKLIRTATK